MVRRAHSVSPTSNKQKATLAHVFAMRALLRDDQAVIFDEAVTKALVEDGR